MGLSLFGSRFKIFPERKVFFGVPGWVGPKKFTHLPPVVKQMAGHDYPLAIPQLCLACVDRLLVKQLRFRWHPDTFARNYIHRFLEAEQKSILQRVVTVSQAVNQIIV